MKSCRVKNLVEKLRTNVCKITFRKLNGDMRTLSGTNTKECLEEYCYSKYSIDKPINPDIITLFDVDDEQFKSIRTDSIKSVYYYEEIKMAGWTEDE